MRTLQGALAAVLLLSASPTVAFPPALVSVPQTSDTAIVAEYDLRIWADATVSVTVAELFGASQLPFSFSNLAITPTVAVPATFAATAHGLLTGDGPVQVTSTVAIPTGLAASTDYYVVKVDANNFKLASSLSLALAGICLAITDVGSGTIDLVSYSATQRLHFHSLGLLGTANDGAISLTTQKSYLRRITNSPTCVAYGLVATVSANSISASLAPVKDVA